MSTPSSNITTYEWEEARQIVLHKVTPIVTARPAETVPLRAAHGRVLAEDVRADRDYPALRRSLRDGFAVKAKDLPGQLLVRGEVRAGEDKQAPLQDGEALEIMTGAPVPDDADAVLMVEHVTRGTGADGKPLVRFDRSVEPGSFVNEQGAESRQGDVLVRKGTRIDSAHVAILAMVGVANVPVFRAPSVAILATGDEIVELDQPLAAHQIRNSNSYMLAAMVQAVGGDPVVLPIARDTKEALRASLEGGLQYDALVVSGGVSAGRYDLVKPTLRHLGAEFHFEKIRIQPGGPASFATLGSKPVFGLPGNPGSTLVTFQLFADPAVRLLCGEKQPDLPLLWATFEAPFRHKLGLTRFLPALLNGHKSTLLHIPWQGSSDVPALARANAFLVAEGDRETWAAGDRIRVMPKL